MSDPKTTYLFAFERAFAALCGGYRAAAGWTDGMWCNAHMYHGQDVAAEDGARRFFDSIMSHPGNVRKLAKLQEVRS